MTQRIVRVTTPARLHFGLLRLEQAAGRSFGGLGAMISQPSLVVEAAVAERWNADGDGAAPRARDAAQRALDAWGDDRDDVPAIDAVVRHPLPAHCGLGSGTQLALAVAAAVRELLDLPPASARELAAVTGRGRRSGVGAHGFVHGGLIWETGRLPTEETGELSAHATLPQTWRVLMAIPRVGAGLSGSGERDAFAALPHVDEHVAARLTQLAEGEILPAACGADFPGFAAAVESYGRISGAMFAPIQGGVFASPQIERRVAVLQDCGATGVGQSSWGPTVFACFADQATAERTAFALNGDAAFAECDFVVAPFAERGATIERIA